MNLEYVYFATSYIWIFGHCDFSSLSIRKLWRNWEKDYLSTSPMETIILCDYPENLDFDY